MLIIVNDNFKFSNLKIELRNCTSKNINNILSILLGISKYLYYINNNCYKQIGGFYDISW